MPSRWSRLFGLGGEAPDASDASDASDAAASNGKAPGAGTASAQDAPPGWRARLAALRYLGPLVRLVWEISPRLTLASAGLRLLRAGLPVAMLWLGKLIIDEVVRLVEAGGAEAASDLATLWPLVAAEFGLAVASGVLGRAVALVDGLLGDRFTNETSERLLRHAARLDLRHFEDAQFYDQLERARRQTTGRIQLLSQLLGQAQDALTALTLGVGMVALAPWLIGLLAVALVPAFLGEAHFNGLSYSVMHARTPARRELDYLRYLGASDRAAKEVKIFGLSGFITRRYRTLADEIYEANRHVATRRASWGSLWAAVGTAGYYAAYAVIVYRTATGVFSVGDLTFLAGSFRRLRRLLEGMLTRFSDIADRALYLEDLFAFFALEPQVVSPSADPAPFPVPIREGFRLEGVGFRYPGTERWVLRDLTLTIRAGETVALVGANGAGKTTLTKLLTRLYDPTEGRLLLDGRDLRHYDLDDLRRHVGVIFQDFVRYHMTAGDNLATGRIEAAGEEAALRRAAEQSLASEVIAGLPGGYDQMLGRRFAGGVELSGGQWQKVALGRAYLRDAQLLVLDEPTAALDARAEHAVFERFADLTQGTTAVLISHRFSTVRMADRILVLDGGQLVEEGSHEALVARGGRYAELFALQASGYR